MESDVHNFKSELYVIDCKEDYNHADRINTSKSLNSQNLENSSLLYLSNTNNNGRSNNQEQKCEYCPATFSNQQELLSHLKIHAFQPTQCDKTFSDANSFVSYMTDHQSKMKWICEFCYKRFSYRSFLEQHRQSHLGLKPFKCGRCNKHYSRLYNLLVHKRRHQSHGTFDCSRCSQKFFHPSNLSRHIRLSHPSQTMHKCTLCPKDFSDLKALSKHLMSHKVTRAASTENALSRKFYKRTFKNVGKVHQNLQTAGTDGDHLSSKKYPSMILQNVRLQSHNKSKKMVNVNHQLKNHSMIVDKKYFCKLCPNQKFMSAKLLLEHQKSSHNGKSLFVCEYCRKEFRFRSILKQHLRKHTGEKPFCCPHCQKGFARLFNLQQHFKRHETENRIPEQETNYETQKEIGWDESVNMENHSSFGNNSQKTDNIHCILTASEVCQNINKEIDKNKSDTFENLSYDYFLEPVNHPVNHPAQKFQEEIVPISQFTSLEDMYINANISEKDTDNKTVLKTLPIQYNNNNSMFLPDIENQQRFPAAITKEAAVISVNVPNGETGKHDEHLDMIFENLPLECNKLSDHSVDQHKPQLEELSIIHNMTSHNNDAYVDKSNNESYIINLETDLSSEIHSKGENPSIVQPYVSNDDMIVEQISTDAVAANNSRILQYLNSQTQEVNLIKEVDKTNYLLEGTTASNATFADSELIDLTDEINDTKTNLNLTCSYCEIICPSLELLNDHLKLHTVKEPFVCGYCQKSFCHSDLLMEHIKDHRKQIQFFRCNNCSKSFSTRNSLTLHQQMHNEVHCRPPQTQLNCTDCNQQFCNLQDLYRHKCISTMNVLTKSFDKSNISDNVEVKNDLEHFQNTTRGTKHNRLYTCEHCSKTFKHQSLLTQHLRKHTGEKPFACVVCGKSFSRLFNLKVHQRKHIAKRHLPHLPSSAVRPAHQINNRYS